MKDPVIALSTYYSINVNGVIVTNSGHRTLSVSVYAMGGYRDPILMDMCEYTTEEIDTIIKKFKEARALLTGEGHD